MSDAYPLFREAEVISTGDPKDLGRIQLRIFPELADVPEGDLPWCFPMASGPHDGDFSTPLEKQWVYCAVWNKYWSEISFLPWCMPDPQKPKFKDFKDKHISKVKDYQGTPDVQHTVGSILEDGFVEFHDTKASQHGILHPKGTYTLINKDGEIFIYSVKKMTFHNTDDTVIATVDSESGDIELRTKGGIKETIDKNTDRTVKGKTEEKVTGSAKHTSANTDIESQAPVGIKGTGTLLGSEVLVPYWTDETAAWSQWPVFIPPVPLPPNIPVPPAPPLINMALNGLKAKLLEADIKASAECAKALK
jgi:hypothetical protein